MPLYAYIAPIIGDGKSVDTAYRSSIADLAGNNSRFYIPSNVDGTPKFGWSFAVVNATADVHNAIQAMTNVTQLPKYSPSTLLKDIPTNIRAAAQNKMTALGINYSSLTLNNPYRDMLALATQFLDSKIPKNELDDLTT